MNDSDIKAYYINAHFMQFLFIYDVFIKPFQDNMLDLYIFYDYGYRAIPVITLHAWVKCFKLFHFMFHILCKWSLSETPLSSVLLRNSIWSTMLDFINYVEPTWCVLIDCKYCLLFNSLDQLLALQRSEWCNEKDAGIKRWIRGESNPHRGYRCSDYTQINDTAHASQTCHSQNPRPEDHLHWT